MIMKRGKLMVASSQNSADLLYATGFMTLDPFIYFSIQDEVTGIVVTALELVRAGNEVKDGITVFDRDDIIPKGCIEKDLKAVIEGIVKKFPVETWEVPATFPFVYAEYLKSLNVDFTCINEEYFPQRSRKTPNELSCIFDAVKLTEKAMLRAETIIREADIQDGGKLFWQECELTSEIIKREINIEAIRGDAIALSTIVACGKHSSEPHNTGSGVIMAGQPIVVDIFPRVESNGYWGDMTRTFVKGKAEKIVREAYKAVKGARDFAKGQIKESVIPSVLCKDVVKYLEKSGFKTGKSNGLYFGFFHGLGHGLGLEIHEKPLVNSCVDEPLKVNEVITVEPGVYYPEWGGVRLEDVVVIKENGIECFTEYPDCLEIE
jgi:Xaa-Pro aminopeptidase